MTAQTILPANTLSSGGYNVANSCMFGNPNTANSDTATDYLLRTYSAGNRRTFTISYWVKRSNLNINNSFQQVIGQQASDYFRVGFGSNEQGNIFRMYGRGGFEFRTKIFARDVTAWYHVCLAIDTTQGTASNRAKLYINGVQQTEFYTENYPDQNTELDYNRGARHTIGKTGGTNGIDAFCGYLAEFVSIDGSALGPTSFGEFDEDSGIWKPIDVSELTFGSQGFYLDFADGGDLGDDESGNENDWAETGIDATNQSTDTCTNNFATFNSLVKGAVSPTFKEGNIQVDAGNNWGHAVGSIGLAAGKWYWEMDNITAQSNAFYGICNEFNVAHLDNDSTPYDQAGLILYFQDGRRTIDGTNSEGEYAAWGTTMACALDLDSGTRTVKFYRDNSAIATVNLTANFAANDFVFPIWLGSASSNANGVDFNFGGTIATALASAESDANGYGNFEFAPPSGYYAICTKNIAEFG